MTIGSQINNSVIDTRLTQLAIKYRDACVEMQNLFTEITANGQGLANLEAAGYNPTDAAAALQIINYFGTLTGVYFGSATQATNFSFHQQFSPLWAGN